MEGIGSSIIEEVYLTHTITSALQFCVETLTCCCIRP